MTAHAELLHSPRRDRASVDEKESVGVVVHDRTGPRIEIRRVPDVVAVHVKVVREEERHMPRGLFQVDHAELFQIDLEFCILPSTRSRLSQDSLNL